MPSFVPLRRPPSRHKPVALAVLTLCTALPAWADEGDDAIRLPAVTIDAGAVERIDTAGMQLLVAFKRDRAANGLGTDWCDVKATLHEAANILGLAGHLGLPAAAVR